MPLVTKIRIQDGISKAGNPYCMFQVQYKGALENINRENLRIVEYGTNVITRNVQVEEGKEKAFAMKAASQQLPCEAEFIVEERQNAAGKFEAIIIDIVFKPQVAKAS